MNLSEYLYAKDGRLYWRVRADRTRQWNGRWANKEAGKAGQVEVNGVYFQTARVLWEMVNGGFDDSLVVMKLNNNHGYFIDNLLCVSVSESNRIRRKNKNKGVYRARDKFKVEVCVNGESFHAGVFTDAKQARSAYRETLDLIGVAQ